MINILINILYGIIIFKIFKYCIYTRKKNIELKKLSELECCRFFYLKKRKEIKETIINQVILNSITILVIYFIKEVTNGSI